jgi:hypothetical protein
MEVVEMKKVMLMAAVVAIIVAALAPRCGYRALGQQL